jgi:hypothetical protein
LKRKVLEGRREKEDEGSTHFCFGRHHGLGGKLHLGVRRDDVAQQNILLAHVVSERFFAVQHLISHHSARPHVYFGGDLGACLEALWREIPESVRKEGREELRDAGRLGRSTTLHSGGRLPKGRKEEPGRKWVLWEARKEERRGSISYQ